MHDERYSKLAQPPAHRSAIAIAEVEINNSRREIGVLDCVEARLKLASRDHPRTCRSQSMVHFEGHDRLILDKEHQAPGERTVTHYKNPVRISP